MALTRLATKLGNLTATNMELAKFVLQCFLASDCRMAQSMLLELQDKKETKGSKD